MFRYAKRVKVFALFLCVWMMGAASLEAAASPKQKPAKTSAKKSVKSRVSTKRAVQRTAAVSKKKPVVTTSSKKSVQKKAPARKTVAPVARQLQPSNSRYREIQQALIDRGFLNGEPTGQWDQQSIDALKKFERSQHLRADGKIDSMVLIALGLGPERTRAANQLLNVEVPVDTESVVVSAPQESEAINRQN